ncbi:cilia- and flagella-associated protein 91 isoform X4 [Scyliorhinus torazame]|uniref:cilia- and flagella-associated protein 91 isoform X4 n=1 Tax=Scyliorhinus torazame TaxID=75743 RepID=UPI003B5BA180
MSFTVTQSLQEKQRFKPERTHDYIYDPLYLVASEKDHAKMSMKAFTSVNRVKKVTDYKTMFSNLQRFPGYTFQLDPNDPVPKFVDQRWRGYGERKQDAIKHLAEHDPSLRMQLQIQQDPQVTGKNRYKYFTRPAIPFVQQLPVNAVLDISKGSSPTNFAELNEQFLPIRTVGVQTDFRDSETQTEPYSPEYVVRPGSAPELLTLAALKFGRGLPAGLAEVEMIERARAKHAWEATLPPLSDHAQREKRKKMMEAMERNEWAFREQEIEKLQEIRLEVLLNLLSQREAKQQEMNVKRVDAIWSKVQQRKVMAIKRIRLEHIKGLLELEEALPDFVTQPRIRIQRPINTTKDGLLKYAARREMELAKIHKAIREAKFKGEKPEKPLRFLFKIVKAVRRPPTPTVEPPPAGEEETYLAIIYLQKLIRGRTVQNMMFEGKEKRIELIQELRTTHALQEDRQLLKQAEMQAILALQHEQNLKQQKRSTMEDYLSHIEGCVLADMFDFLNKELLRLQEERRIHAIVMLAERRRRIREAEESGLRQVEERRRREEDEIFKQIIKVHQTTVDSYLEDILLKSVEATAEDQARQEICKMADEINDIAYEIEQHRTRLQSQEIVSELVHSFLIPEAHKIIMRDRVKQFQSRHLLVAHRIIHNEAERIMTDSAPSVSESSSVVVDVMDQALAEVEIEIKETNES